MTNNKKKDHLQQKLDGLNMLSAGIVFDKDNAWYKLQHRLDAKKKKRVWLYYPLSAAACLFILALAFHFFYNTKAATYRIRTEMAVYQARIAKSTALLPC